jgi:hypothetical protein
MAEPTVPAPSVPAPVSFPVPAPTVQGTRVTIDVGSLPIR